MTEHKRPLLFMIVGIGNTVLDFASYTTLTLTVFRGSLAWAGVVSGTIALVVAFMSHAFITWRGRGIGRSTVLKFLAITGFGMWAIRPLLLLLFAKLTWLYAFAFNLSQTLRLPFNYDFIVSTGAFGFMIIVLLTYNYFTYDRFVFNNKSRG